MLFLAALCVCLAVASASDPVLYDVTCEMGNNYSGDFKGNIYLIVKTKKFIGSSSEQVSLDQDEEKLGFMPNGYELNAGKKVDYKDVPFKGTLDRIKSVQVKWYNTFGESKPAQVHKCQLTEKDTKKSQAYCYNGKAVLPGEVVDMEKC